MWKNKCYKIAEICFSVETQKEYDSISPYNLFLTSDPAAITYTFSEVESLVEATGKLVFESRGMTVWRDGETELRYLRAGGIPYACSCFSDGVWNTPVLITKDAPELWEGFMIYAMGLEHLLAQNERMILHASYIDIGGEAILFTAPCQTGKSTQAALWEKFRRAEIINGDRVCLSADGETVMAHGLPVAGTSGICKNRSLPVKAIVALSQAPGNSIRRLAKREALKALYSGSWVNSWNGSDVERVMALIGRIIEKVPVLHLACAPDESAVALLEKTIE